VGVCVTTVDAIPEGLEGIVAMGKWSKNDTEASYLMQLYL